MPQDLFNLQPGIQRELSSRHDELSRLEQEQTQMGTSIPQLYGSISKFISNPSTVSVETYKRMLDTDETVGSGIDFMNLCMLARFGEYKHPSPEITQYVRQVLNAINQDQGGWYGALEEMVSAEWAGFSLTEQIWNYQSDFAGGPGFIPSRLVTYQPLTIVFAVDQAGELLPDGIYQYQRYNSNYMSNAYAVTAGSNGFRPDMNAASGDMPYPIRISADLSYLTVKIPKSKCIHLRSSVTGTFRNPYGRSILRRVYKNWVLKDAFLKMWLIAADRKGTPLVVGYAGPNDTVLNMDSADGKSSVSEQRSDVAMANVFKTIHNSSFIVLPGKKGDTFEVDSVQVQGDMNVFKDGTDYFNKSIMRGLLIPPLIMGGDGGGSYSLGQEHHKIFSKIIDGKLKVHKAAILSQFVRKIIAYNFPKSAWQKDGFGEFQLEEYDPEVMERLANIFQTVTTNGYMTPEDQNDVDHVRQKMGLPKGRAQMPVDPQPVEEELPEDDNGKT